MPNWVQINLHFKGEESKIKEMLEKFKGDMVWFNFVFALFPQKRIRRQNKNSSEKSV